MHGESNWKEFESDSEQESESESRQLIICWFDVKSPSLNSFLFNLHRNLDCFRLLKWFLEIYSWIQMEKKTSAD